MGSRRNTRQVTSACPGGFILIQRCTTHDRLRFRGPQHHAPQSGTRRVPALRFRGIMKPFSALSSKLKIIRATASAHSSTSSALPSVATKIDQYPYASLRLRSNVVIGNTRAGRVPPPPQPCFARALPINAKGFTRLNRCRTRENPPGVPTGALRNASELRGDACTWDEPPLESYPCTSPVVTGLQSLSRSAWRYQEQHSCKDWAHRDHFYSAGACSIMVRMRARSPEDAG
jgi:hypothetical protein